jgi:hypothetical protein
MLLQKYFHNHMSLIFLLYTELNKFWEKYVNILNYKNKNKSAETYFN